VDVSISMTKKRLKGVVRAEAAEAAEEYILNKLVGVNSEGRTKESFRYQLRSGDCDELLIDYDMPTKSSNPVAFDINNPGTIATEIFKIAKGGAPNKAKKESRKMKVSEARPLIEGSYIDTTYMAYTYLHTYKLTYTHTLTRLSTPNPYTQSPRRRSF
jgi:ATP-dependent protease HslVU (ClpYQ) ATPase subunit